MRGQPEHLSASGDQRENSKFRSLLPNIFFSFSSASGFLNYIPAWTWDVGEIPTGKIEQQRGKLSVSHDKTSVIVFGTSRGWKLVQQLRVEITVANLVLPILSSFIVLSGIIFDLCSFILFYYDYYYFLPRHFYWIFGFVKFNKPDN